MAIPIWLATTIKEGRILEHFQADIWRCNDIEVVPDRGDSPITVPVTPGIGVNVVPERIKKFQVRTAVFDD